MDVEFRNINKTFGTVRANIGIQFAIPAGTIQGILGENGAGKSTLMKILSGYILPDSGEIYLDGKRAKIENPADAIHYGIGMLHQDPLDFPPMKALDNFIIGKPGGLFPPRREAERAFLDLRDQFGFTVDPNSYVDSMTVGERQQLEILRLLWLGVRVFILDEPTTGISAQQKEKLFLTLRQLADKGNTVIFVSHKLEDVEALCDRVVVLRRGELAGQMMPPYDTDRLVEMMFGKVIKLDERMPCSATDKLVLKLESVAIDDYRLQIRNVSLDVRCGEVIGLAGMEGSGQDLLLRACGGLIRTVGGRVIVNGKDLTGKDAHTFMRHGVTFMPASRLEEGLIPGLSINEHCILTGEQKGIFVNRDAARVYSQNKITEYSIRGVPESRVEALSGGNQQRTLLALLKDELSLILLEHPTRGLDIESTIYIWSKLKERCARGAAILFISPDLEEILQYSDRVIVFYSGRVSPALDATMTTVEQLGQLIGGKGWEEIFDKQQAGVSNAA